MNLEQEIEEAIQQHNDQCSVLLGNILTDFKSDVSFYMSPDINGVGCLNHVVYIKWFYDNIGLQKLDSTITNKIKQICSKYDKALLLTSPMKYVRELAKEL